MAQLEYEERAAKLSGTRPQIWLVGPIPGRLSQCLR